MTLAAPNWNELKTDAFNVIESLADSDRTGKDKQDELQAQLKELMGDSITELAKLLPGGLGQAVSIALAAGGRDLALSIAAPMLGEVFYKLWKAVHGGGTQ
jgi:hypothetical protein